MSRLARRVARLERRAELATFDPRAICRLAGRCYLAGQPLPADLTGPARRLAVEYYRAVVLTEEARWWDRTLPLPMPSPFARPVTS